jgi:hypothetical protein
MDSPETLTALAALVVALAPLVTALSTATLQVMAERRRARPIRRGGRRR